MGNRKCVLLILAITTTLMPFGCSKGYETQKSAGDLKITLSAERYPLIKGDNAMMVLMNDSAGNAVTDAVVNVRYSMPPMPGMAPMDFNTQAVLKGDRYVYTANVPMEGEWKTEVSVTRPGKPPVSAAFNVDAR